MNNEQLLESFVQSHQVDLVRQGKPDLLPNQVDDTYHGEIIELKHANTLLDYVVNPKAGIPDKRLLEKAVFESWLRKLEEKLNKYNL